MMSVFIEYGRVIYLFDMNNLNDSWWGGVVGWGWWWNRLW